MTVTEVRHYVNPNGSDVFAGWLSNLRDITAKKAIDRRIRLLKTGHFGDAKPLRDGIWELRIDVGPGYRVYFAKAGSTIVLLLCGGDKRRQDNDIARANGYWLDWQRRKKKENGDAGQTAR